MSGRALRQAVVTGAAVLAAGGAGGAELTLPRVSPRAKVSQTIGLGEVIIQYGRPGVKGRPIWGDLVPYDQVWRTGANEATTITLSEDLRVNGQPLAAGTYSLHTIPGRSEWTLIFNRVADQWGSYEYRKEDDVLRLPVRPVEAPFQEWLTFEFTDLALGSARAVLHWERIGVPFTLESDVLPRAMASIRAAMAERKPDDWRTPMRAADFYLRARPEPEGDRDLDQAMRWAEDSIKVKENVFNLNLKARILAERGKKAEAIALAQRALQVGKAAAAAGERVDTAPTERLLAEWRAGAAAK